MTLRRFMQASIVALSAGLLGLAAAQQSPEPPEDPREIGLVEKTTGQLAQLDLTVTGPAEAISDLTQDDFELVIQGTFIEQFLVDRLCPQPQEVPAPSQVVAKKKDAVPEPAAPPPPRAPVTYLFYFDQHHLTAGGRQNSLDTARTLIPRLIIDGNRAIVISAGEELGTFAELTDDPMRLLEALDYIERDRRQWDLFPYEEEQRILRVADEFYEDTTRAVSMARMYQREERYHTDRALRLFSMVLGRMADLDPPKAVIYFGDTMRMNAGAHYLAFFGAAQRENDVRLTAITSAMEMDAMAAATAFDRVVEEAASHGVRLYTVQAQGLVTASSLIPARARGAQINTQHISDAQDTLVGMAMESGGRAFLNGVPAAKIAKQIAADLNCVYLLSFDPSGFPQDKQLPVLVRVKRPKVEAHARGTMVLQSESTRDTSRLLAAFTDPSAVTADWPLRGVVIPTGYERGQFRSLVQVAVPGSPLSRTEWDIGLSLVSGGKVRDDGSSRVTVTQPGVPVVFEKEVTFKPGPFEIIMVAREINSGQLATTRIEGDWPDPDDSPGSVGPIAVLQPSPGLFLRDGQVRTSGALGKDDVQPALTGEPTVLVGLVCRGKSDRGTLRVERRLAGADVAPFPLVEIEPGDERCAQIRDHIPAGTMTPGGFVYDILVFDKDEQVASSSREFGAVGPERASRQGDS